MPPGSTMKARCMARFRVTQIEKRRRGPFGWFVAILFYGFNAIMVVLMVGGWASVGTMVKQGYDDLSVAGRALPASSALPRSSGCGSSVPSSWAS